MAQRREPKRVSDKIAGAREPLITAHKGTGGPVQSAVNVGLGKIGGENTVGNMNGDLGPWNTKTVQSTQYESAITADMRLTASKTISGPGVAMGSKTAVNAKAFLSGLSGGEQVQASAVLEFTNANADVLQAQTKDVTPSGYTTNNPNTNLEFTRTWDFTVPSNATLITLSAGAAAKSPSDTLLTYYYNGTEYVQGRFFSAIRTYITPDDPVYAKMYLNPPTNASFVSVGAAAELGEVSVTDL